MWGGGGGYHKSVRLRTRGGGGQKSAKSGVRTMCMTPREHFENKNQKNIRNQFF